MTRYGPHRPLRGRVSIRLRGYDYRRQGAYFITVCTRERGTILGDIENGTVRLNTFGRLVVWSWLDLERHHRGVTLDDWVVMPDHVHGIIALPTNRLGPAANGTTRSGPPRASIGSIAGSFKAAAARRVNAQRASGIRLWQRGYYERIIRDAAELERVRRHIRGNPRRGSCGPPQQSPPTIAWPL
jgi:putative transposase